MKKALEIYSGISWRAPPIPVYVGGNKVIQVVGKQIEKALNGKVSPKEALGLAAAEAEKIVKEEFAKRGK